MPIIQSLQLFKLYLSSKIRTIAQTVRRISQNTQLINLYNLYVLNVSKNCTIVHTVQIIKCSNNTIVQVQ